MVGYILDVNMLDRWFHQHAAVVARVSQLDQEQLRVSAITLGELEFGHEIHLQNRDLQKRDAFARWIDQQFPKARILDVTRHTRFYYGRMKARLFEKYPPRSANENHPECCYDPTTGKELGFDENGPLDRIASD